MADDERQGIPARIGPPQSLHRRQFVPAPHEFSDEESSDLLMAIHAYVLYYDITNNSISDLAAEIAQSMDRTTDAEDRARRDIEIHFENYAVPPAAS